MIYLGDKEIGIAVGGGGAEGASRYLINYIEQEDGTFEMAIMDYFEGVSGEVAIISSEEIEGTDLVNLRIFTEGNL